MGQLRALGTKQHLKSKFGSGYELTIKYHTKHLQASPQQDNNNDNNNNNNQQQPKQTIVSPAEQITNFIISIFPSSKFLSDNGGLMTFTIPRNEMKMGVAFNEIESHKDELFIEDYSIAQSTLEQVFIRTVQANTPLQDRKLISSTSRQRFDDVLGQQDELEHLNEAEEVIGVYRDALNSCGCTMKFTKYSSGGCCFLFLLFFICSLAFKVSVLIVFAIIFLIIFLICCMLCSCPCCKPPKDNDE